QHALYRHSVIYTAPAGTGKTSLLRAGLVPRLEALGVRPVYLRCRPDCGAGLASAIWPDGESAADARTLPANGAAAATGEARASEASDRQGEGATSDGTITAAGARAA